MRVQARGPGLSASWSWDPLSWTVLHRKRAEQPWKGLLWSPDGAKFLGTYDDKIAVFSASLNDILTVNFSAVSTSRILKSAWSPDGSMIFTVDPQRCHVWNASTGSELQAWNCDGYTVPSWSPGPYIAIGSPIRLYHPNGTVLPNFKERDGTIYGWGPNSTLAVLTSTTVRTVPHSSSPFLGTTMRTITPCEISAGDQIPCFVWSSNGKLLAIPSLNDCEVRSAITLELLLEIRETHGHTVIGFSPDGSWLLTLDTLGGIRDNFVHFFVWNTRLPVNVLPPHSGGSFQPDTQWIDKDRLLYRATSGTGYELDIRSGQWTELQLPYRWESVYCLMDGMIFSMSANGTVTVFERGSMVRSWETHLVDANIICSSSTTSQIATALDEGIIHIWDNKGGLIKVVDVHLDITFVIFAGEHNLAFTTNESYFIWNTSTQLPNRIEVDPYACSQMVWSPDGKWLACGESWSSDSSIILTRDGDFDIRFASPKLGVDILADGTYSSWNPVTMEVYALDDRVWLPSPDIQKLVIGEVGQQTRVQVTAIGANLLSIAPATRAMLKWTDSATSVTQCIFLNGTVYDPYNWTSEPITLTEPGLYTIYFEYPSLDLPWLGPGEVSFTASCPGNAVSFLSTSGSLTSCVCPQGFYTVGESSTGIKCSNCPDNAHCNGSSLILANPGYWPLAEDPTQFLRCAGGACSGDNHCAEWYYGPVCGLCRPGSGQHGFGQCSRCNAGWLDVLLLCLGFLCWAGLCTIQSLFALGWKSSPRKGNSNAQLAATLVSTAQMNALLLSVNIDLSAVSGYVGHVGGTMQDGGGVQTAVFSCLAIAAGFRPDSVHFVKQVLLLFLPILAGLFLLGLRAGLKWKGIHTSTDIVRVPVVVVWLSLQSSTNTSLLQTLSCTSVNSAGFRYRLSYDFSVACFTSKYWVMLGVVTIPGIIITMIALPLTISFLLRFRPSSVASGHLKFLVKTYRIDWWLLVVYLRKLLLVVVVIFTKNALYVACCMMVACILHMAVVPSTSHVVNIAEGVSLLTSTFIFAMVGGLAYENDLTYRVGPELLVIVVLLSYGFQLGLLIYDRYAYRKADFNNSQREFVLLQDIENATET